MMSPGRHRLVVALAAALLLGAAPTAAGDEDATEPRVTTLPSFNESPGCGGPDGVRGPFATRSGDLPASEPIFGPWGDFYGRDIASVRSRLVKRHLPSPSGPVAVWVHSRVAPALDLVIRNLEREAAAGRTYRIRSWDTWSYRAATVPPGLHLSFHAVGAAIDVNSTTNPYRPDNVLITDMPAWFVKAWTDAGWCWGGAWQTKKDPMHFSWQGPLATPGYRVPAPYSPWHAPADFTRTVSFTTALGATAEDGTLLMADLDRDGAADAVRVRPWTPAGHLGVEAAQAIHGFETCSTADVTAWPGAAVGTRLLADYDADGRPDLWDIDTSGPTAVVSIYSFASGFSDRIEHLVTAFPVTPGAVFLAGDHDRDGRTDLYVVRPGNPGTVAVWRDWGDAPALEARLPFAVRPHWRFALGERDGDGVPDLFALEPGDVPRLRIVTAASGFTGRAEALDLPGGVPDGAFAVEDLDGDGRGDLYFLDAAGRLTVHLGGQRTVTDAQLTYWFREARDGHWQRGQGCPVDPGEGFPKLQVATAGPVGAILHPGAEGWALRGVAPGAAAWEAAGTGRGEALAVVPAPEEDLLAVLRVDERATVALFTAAGEPAGLVRFGLLADPRGLVALAAAGTPALGVVDGGSEGAGLVIRTLDGARLARVGLGLDPIAVATRDLDEDGSSGLVVLGTLEGEPRLRVLDLRGRPLAEAALPAGGGVEGLALLSEGRAAVLWRSAATGQAQVLVFDAALALLARHAVPPDTRAVLGGVGGDVAVVYRGAEDGRVWAQARDAVTGTRRYRVLLPAGFEPAWASAGPGGTLVLASQRRGDGAIRVESRAADGSLLFEAQFAG
jgi:hypothetical protein